jgi:hypothetical protein
MVKGSVLAAAVVLAVASQLEYALALSSSWTQGLEGTDAYYRQVSPLRKKKRNTGMEPYSSMSHVQRT